MTAKKFLEELERDLSKRLDNEDGRDGLEIFLLDIYESIVAWRESQA